MSIEEFLVELDERIENAEEDAKESHKVAMNSYGAGYDRGYLDALLAVKEFIIKDE